MLIVLITRTNYVCVHPFFQPRQGEDLTAMISTALHGAFSHLTVLPVLHSAAVHFLPASVTADICLVHILHLLTKFAYIPSIFQHNLVLSPEHIYIHKSKESKSLIENGPEVCVTYYLKRKSAIQKEYTPRKLGIPFIFKII